jgi:hypothetical protein
MVSLLRAGASSPQVSAPVSHPDEQALDFGWIPTVALRRDAGAVGLVVPARAGRETEEPGPADRLVARTDVGLRAAISAELATLESEIRQLVERSDRAAAPVFGPGGAGRLYAWAAAAAAVAVLAGEISRRQLRPAGVNPSEVGHRAEDSADDLRNG